jgi:hypothetical protein
LTAPLNTASAQAYNFAAGKPSNVPGLTNIAAATVPINTTGGVGGQQLTNISKGLPINANIPASLQQMAQTGSPIDQTAAWKAMVAAEQQQIANNAALLREQYNVGGANPGSSSPGSLGMANFYEQTALGQTAQLTQAQAQAMENAAQRQLQAGEYIQGQGQQAQEFTQGQQLTASQQLQAQSQQGQEFQAQQQQQAGQFLSSLGTGLDQMFQGMDQSAIQNALSEFIRTNPEYSPLLNTIFSAASTFPPTVRNSYGAGLAGLLGALAPLLGLLKPKASAPGAPGGAGGAGGTGGAGGSAGPTQPTQVPTQQPQQAPPPTQTGGSTSTVYPDPTDPFFSSQGSPTGTLGTSEGVYTGFDNQNPFNLIYPNDTSNMPVDSGQVPSAGLSGIPSFTSGGNDASGNINPDEQAIIDSMLSMGYPGYDVGTSQDPNFGNLYT